MVRHISYSYIHLLACPYAAFLRYEGAIRSGSNEYLALGNGLHLALELGHANGDFDAPLAAKVFLKEFNRIITDEDVFVGYPKKKKMEAEGLEMLVLFASQIEKGIIKPRPFGNEVEFKIPYEGIEIVGRIDRIEYDPEIGYDIIDYKSGGKEPDEWFLRHNLQLTTYAWACQVLYGELPNSVVWHHLRNGKLLATKRTQDDIDDLKRMLSNAIFMDKKEIRHRIFHEQICNWCDFKGAVCDDRELEAQIVEASKLKRRKA